MEWFHKLFVLILLILHATCQNEKLHWINELDNYGEIYFSIKWKIFQRTELDSGKIEKDLREFVIVLLLDQMIL
jgi:hypothetical protein